MPQVSSTNVALGNINPKWIGSGITSITFKGITLGAQIDIRHGGSIWNGTRGAMGYFGTSQETADRTSTKTFAGVYGHIDLHGNVVHFAADGKTELPGYGDANSTNVTLGQYYWQNVGSSFIGPIEPDVEDGSYIKLRQKYNMLKFQSLEYNAILEADRFDSTNYASTYSNITFTENDKAQFYKEKFLKAINKDFNIAMALGIMWSMIKDKEVTNAEKLELINDFNKVFGLELN